MSARDAVRALLARTGYELTSRRRVGVHPWWDMDRIRPLRAFTTVLDVGAHQGESAVVWAGHAPRARVISFEPVASNYARLVANTRHLPAVACVRAAVGSAPGELPLYAGDWSQAGTLMQRPGAPVVEVVPVTTVDAVVAERGLARIDLLKTDTEGYDLEVVRGAAKTLEAGLVDFVYAEVSFEPDDAAHTPFASLAGALSGYGYRLLGLYEVVHWPDPWRIGYCNALFTRA